MNLACCELYSSCYEFDSHGQAYWFDEDKLRKNKDRILDLLSRIKKSLDAINDGSFVVEDKETEKIEML